MRCVQHRGQLVLDDFDVYAAAGGVPFAVAAILFFALGTFALAYFAFGGREEPLDDIHIRRAIQHAFDVSAYVEAALEGDGRTLSAVVRRDANRLDDR